MFNSPKHFPYEEGTIAEDKVTITNDRVLYRFEGIPTGSYGVAVYHDENANHEFDQGLFGIPLEDYGFSNNAPVFFGPPTFVKAQVQVTEPMTTIEIDLRK